MANKQYQLYNSSNNKKKCLIGYILINKFLKVKEWNETKFFSFLVEKSFLNT